MRIPTRKENRIIQIEVTTRCDLDCLHCTRALAQIPKIDMPLDLFEKAVVACKDWILRERGVLALFGGNACLHPHFPDLCRILRSYLPENRVGLWTNNIFNHGPTIRQFFGPTSMFNFIAHGKPAAYDKIVQEVPFARAYGRERGSKHASIFVAPQDFMTEDEIWRRQKECSYDITWSAIVMMTPDWKDIEGYSCEIAGTHSRVNVLAGKLEKSLGVPVVPGWLDGSVDHFRKQYEFACPRCSGLMNLDGVMDLDKTQPEQFSKSNAHIVPLTVSTKRLTTIVEDVPPHDHRKPIEYLK